MDPVEHRCPRNFPLDKSTKSMEGYGAVMHCVNIGSRVDDRVQAYVHTLVTNDDRTTRANVRWKKKEYFDAIFGEGNWTKKLVGWPKTSDKLGAAYTAENGFFPLEIPQVERYLSDIAHRVKSIGKRAYKLEKQVKEMKGFDCEKIKRLAAYSFHTNRDLPFKDFKTRSHCIYMHHFDDHSLHLKINFWANLSFRAIAQISGIPRWAI
jgi:hypothetical protein